MHNVELKVAGMSCNHCVHSIEGAIEALGAKGKADLASGSVTVQFDEHKLALETIKAAIEDQGYDVL